VSSPPASFSSSLRSRVYQKYMLTSFGIPR
jgi:hypothetical protein